MNLEAPAKRATFRKLHESGHFILPNPWDIGGARLASYAWAAFEAAAISVRDVGHLP